MARDPRGFAAGDLVLALAVCSLLAALAWPWFRHTAFLDRVESTVEHVDAVRGAVAAFRDQEGEWPPPAPTGEPSDALRPFLPLETTFRGERYALELRRWVAVEAPPPAPAAPEDDPEELVPAEEDEVPAPPPTDSTQAPPPTARPLALLSVHSADSALLAALLDNFGSADSFVRDTVWTLVFPWETPR